MGIGANAGTLLCPQGRELSQECRLSVVKFGRHFDEEMDVQVTPRWAAQSRSPLASEKEYLTGLGTGPDVENLLTVKGVEGHGRA